MKTLATLLLFFASAAHAGSRNFQINTYTHGYQELPQIVAHSDGTYTVVWESGCNSFSCGPDDFGQDGSAYGIFAKRLAADGRELPAPPDKGNGAGNEFQVNTYTLGNQFGPWIAGDSSGRSVVVWSSEGQYDGQDIIAQRLAPDGSKLCPNGLPAPANCPGGSELLVNDDITAGDQRAPEVGCAADGTIIFVWTEFKNFGTLNDVYARIFDPEGNPKGPSFVVNDQTAGNQTQYNDDNSLAVDGEGNFAVSWSGSGQGQVAKRYDKDGIPLPPPAAEQGAGVGFEFQLPGRGDSKYAPNGDLVFSYGAERDGVQKLRAMRYNTSGEKVCPDGSPLSACAGKAEFELSTHENLPGALALGGKIAFNPAGEMAAFWFSIGQVPGTHQDPYLQRFDASMEKTTADAGPAYPEQGPRKGEGTEVLLQLNTIGAAGTPGAVAFGPSRFLAAWMASNAQDGEGIGVFGQLTPERGDDTVWKHLDVCPGIFNPDQEDTDGNGVGDDCNEGEDADGDEYREPDRTICGGRILVGFDGDFSFCHEVICGQAGQGPWGSPPTYCADNCPHTPNPDQANSNMSAWGDACEPTVDVLRVSHIANRLGADARIDDPNGDELSGLITIKPFVPHVLPASPLRSCSDIYPPLPDDEPGEGIGYISLPGLHVMLDSDFFGGCRDGRQDYRIAGGKCTGISTGGRLIAIDQETAPFDLCLTRLSDSSQVDITVTAFDADSVSFEQVGAPVLEEPYSRALPNSTALSGLTVGVKHLLMLTTTDANTGTVSDAVPFTYQGESFLHFNKVVLCHDPEGDRKTLTVSLQSLETHLNHGDLDGPCP